MVETESELATDGSIEICLPIKSEIIQADRYNTFDFAERVGSSTYTYRAAGLTIKNTDTRSRLCADVTKVNTWFCPVKVAASQASLTADVGAFSCPAMATM